MTSSRIESQTRRTTTDGGVDRARPISSPSSSVAPAVVTLARDQLNLRWRQSHADAYAVPRPRLRTAHETDTFVRRPSDREAAIEEGAKAMWAVECDEPWDCTPACEDLRDREPWGCDCGRASDEDKANFRAFTEAVLVRLGLIDPVSSEEGDGGVR